MSWSHGEVTLLENHQLTAPSKPERDGLFCAKIFGPVTDWECLCGSGQRMKHRGVICERGRGVEVTLSGVRRGSVSATSNFASPCSHVWFFKACRRASATCWTSPCAT